MFPDIVQKHSAHQHVQVSLRRSGKGSRTLSYEAFVECLCRIAFVYLSVYGNSVQQMAPSKRKCLWFITLLRAGCRDAGLNEIVFPGGEGEWFAAHSAFDHSTQTHRRQSLDRFPLESLVLWRTLNA